MKDIKDFLHLYVNSECEFGYEGRDKKRGTIEFCDTFGANVFDPSLIPTGFRKVNPDLIKPILRPLSSMTEEEGMEIFEDWNSDSPNSRDVIKNNDPLELTFLPSEFQKLLSKGFDLFGLCEEGLAIDKTKL